MPIPPLVDPNPSPRLTTLSHGGGCGCKIAPGLLAELLRDGPVLPMPAQLLVGRDGSDDAAIYQIDDERAIVATTDFFMPIVDDPFDFGRIAAANALSDLYAMGARPMFALAIVGMPIKTLTPATIRTILHGGEASCAAAGIPIAGGHSIDSAEPIYGLAAIGIIEPAHIKRNAGASAGDILVLGKPLGIGVYSAALKQRRLDAAGYRELIDATTRLNLAGTTLARLDAVHAMTDVTGFGLLGHSLEMCRGSGLRAELEVESIPLLPQTRILAEAGCLTGASRRNWQSYETEVTLEHGLDPIWPPLLSDPQTSGGLLVACAESALDTVLAAFTETGLGQARPIGRLAHGPARVHVRA